MWVVDEASDKIAASTDCAYHRFIFKDPMVEDFTGNWGIRTDVPEEVSDHYSIWAEFSTESHSRL